MSFPMPVKPVRREAEFILRNDILAGETKCNERAYLLRYHAESHICRR